MNTQTNNQSESVKMLTLKKIQTDFPAVQITNSQAAADFIRQFYSDDIEIYESFFILLLNRAMVTTGYAKISQGGVTGTVVDIKIIAKYAVDFLASSVILAHNHPSGALRASTADIQITKKAVEALKILDVDISDHVILTENRYLSLRDEGHF
jgi:DNA repair protein RadC